MEASWLSITGWIGKDNVVCVCTCTHKMELLAIKKETLWFVTTWMDLEGIMLSEKLTNLITWTTALSNSMKLWAMPCRANQDRQVMVESSEKMWSTGEGNGKPLQYSCLKNPMNSMKRQKDRTLKGELPRSVGAQYATGDQWRNNSKRNEEMEPTQNNIQVWMWLVMEARSDAVKSNIA